MCVPYDRMSDDERKKWHKAQGDPATHKDHEFEGNISKDGIVTFHCISCDVAIFLGQLNGFDEPEQLDPSPP